VGIDPSRRAIDVARELSGRDREGASVTFRVADGLDLPFRAGRFDVALAVTVVLHVAEPERLVREMLRTVTPGGRIGLQDQDFGTLAVTHPDPGLTDRILRGVVSAIYEEPYSGRRLPGLLREAGAEHVRLRTEVYQDTELEPYTKTFLERRAELAVRYGMIDAATAQRWLDGFTALVAAGDFVMTLNYFGAIGVKPGRRRAGSTDRRPSR
jgi:SAM-dependent methyltransferase